MLAVDDARAVSELNLLAVSQDKAILHIDGQRRVMRVGETSPEGVTLTDVSADEARVSVDGRSMVLPIVAVSVGGVSQTETKRAVVWADTSGSFFVEGTVNKRSVRFLVDTGATTIAFNSREAKRLGLDYTAGQQGIASTAGGMVPMYHITLTTVQVGDIKLYNVPAGVIEGNHPVVSLLGMSFLGHVEMRREGMRMELIDD